LIYAELGYLTVGDWISSIQWITCFNKFLYLYV